MTKCQQGLPRRYRCSQWRGASTDCFGFASLKLGISDSIVEVSLKGTIRLREQVPKAHGALLAMTRCLHRLSISGRDNLPKGISSQDSWGFASLKLGIYDSVVEVFLQGTIRLREQVPGYGGKSIQFNRTNCEYCFLFATISVKYSQRVPLIFFQTSFCIFWWPGKNGADGCFESDGKTNRSFLIQ